MPSPEPTPVFAPPDAFAGPPRPAAFSRWKKSSISYGPWGRIAATILLVALPVWFALSYSFVMLIMWVFVIGPLLLRSIWKKTRVPA